MTRHLARRGPVDELADHTVELVGFRVEWTVTALLEDDEIALTIGHIGIDAFTNYFAYIAEVDFPLIDAVGAYPSAKSTA